MNTFKFICYYLLLHMKSELGMGEGPRSYHACFILVNTTILQVTEQ